MSLLFIVRKLKDNKIQERKQKGFYHTFFGAKLAESIKKYNIDIVIVADEKKTCVVPQNNKFNYNCRRRKGNTVEAENRDEGLQGPSFHPKKQETVEKEGGREPVYRLPLLENGETNGETGNICQTHIFSDLSHALVSPKANLIFLW